MAVTGLSQSLDNTRDAAARLSDHGIATIGSVVTADNMNTNTHDVLTKNFYRIGPTNSDEVGAAANYIVAHNFRNVMLVEDTGSSDSYDRTLASAFKKKKEIPEMFTENYTEPGSGSTVTGTTRGQYLRAVFDGKHSEICDAHPDLIYFAGRGTDLLSFVTALSRDGACQSLPSVTVMTGDDVDNLVGTPLNLGNDIRVNILYTALGYPNEWNSFPKNSPYRQNYDDFATTFTRTYGFPVDDLTDASAMMENDAAVTSIKAAEADPGTNPSSIENFLSNIDCHSSVGGASGFIAFNDTGSQIDKAMPILRITSAGSPLQVDLAWSQGHPLDTSSTCS
jgi:ABC-type branched-subunit amino acid transport system substrate-binding protein